MFMNVENKVYDSVQWNRYVCECVWEREIQSTNNRQKTIKLYSQELIAKNLQRAGEVSYIVTFSLYSLTTTASWERGGDLTTY